MCLKTVLDSPRTLSSRETGLWRLQDESASVQSRARRIMSYSFSWNVWATFLHIYTFKVPSINVHRHSHTWRLWSVETKIESGSNSISESQRRQSLCSATLAAQFNFKRSPHPGHFLPLPPGNKASKTGAGNGQRSDKHKRLETVHLAKRIQASKQESPWFREEEEKYILSWCTLALLIPTLTKTPRTELAQALCLPAHRLQGWRNAAAPSGIDGYAKVGKGLILGPNSPFKNIPILGAIL